MTNPNDRHSADNTAGVGAESSAEAWGTDNGFLRVKHPRQRALLRVLAFAHRNRVAAAPLVERLAYEYDAAESHALRQVAYLLASGVPVISALEQTHGAVDETTLLGLRLAEETGTLTRTYELCLLEASDARFQTDDPFYSPTTALMQRAMGIFVACFVLTFLALFIVPTFVAMMDEFGLEMPRFPLWLLEFYSSFGSLLLLFSLTIIAWLIVYALWLRDWQWQPRKPAYPRRPAAVRFRALLALAVGSGRPVASALATLTRYQTPTALRSRLVAALRSMENGEDPWSVLARHRLLRRREARALSLAPDGATAHWLLQQAAVASTHRYESLRGIMLKSVSFFLLVGLAIIVGLTAISFFMVLSELISGLT